MLATIGCIAEAHVSITCNFCENVPHIILRCVRAILGYIIGWFKLSPVTQFADGSDRACSRCLSLGLIVWEGVVGLARLQLQLDLSIETM